MTTVVKVDRRTNNFTLYIGRAWAGLPASKWANPFRVIMQSGDDALDVCLERYESYVRSRPDLMAALHEIDDQVLGCWCHTTPSIGVPIRCHGDVLIKLRAEQAAIELIRGRTFCGERDCRDLSHVHEGDFFRGIHLWDLEG